ncbi:Variant SH3 domain containing protein [Trichomonas vaginalis G3]|uniref:Variant SH3 domain containing protein n=1 Tax=Trichomonas vaginalis (strain ATCC PRA-98 / G3) TaxID=412133 RepID=A2EK24_TRIV3|nr:SH3-domain family [Trichomonas vaginalis G3]EAY07008.1 Variant SH3 domain containing protein [Trichomonas vaginalis G3]KAI5488812.1 SH3-domain family [Trichomonas vaginalis G3]|eukprot:XP_001319231.1 Variant SH3 domain containing protein [Trichomonas vaginalis G3]
MQVPEQEGKIINQLEKILTAASSLYDSRKDQINSDISYLENVYKIMTGLTASLGFKSDNPFLMHSFYSLPAGIAFEEMYKSFNNIASNINNEALPGLKKCVSQLTSSKQKVSNNIKQNMYTLRKNAAKYYETATGIAKSRETFSILDNLDNQYIHGNQSHSSYMTLLQTIIEVEDATKADLNEQEKLLGQIKETEASIIEKSCQTISTGLPFLKDIPNKKREYQDTEEVPHWRNIILQVFLELKTTHTIIPVSPRESAGFDWMSYGKMTPFYARVWEDHTKANNDEIDLTRKETVKVLQVDYGNYWVVQKSDESTGLAPCTKLQPVE